MGFERSKLWAAFRIVCDYFQFWAQQGENSKVMGRILRTIGFLRVLLAWDALELGIGRPESQKGTTTKKPITMTAILRPCNTLQFLSDSTSFQFTLVAAGQVCQNSLTLL